MLTPSYNEFRKVFDKHSDVVESSKYSLYLPIAMGAVGVLVIMQFV